MQHASIPEGVADLRKKYGFDSALEWNRSTATKNQQQPLADIEHFGETENLVNGGPWEMFVTWITKCSQNVHKLQTSSTKLPNISGLQPHSKPLESFLFPNNEFKLTYWTSGIYACGTDSENENPKTTDKEEDGVPKAWQDMVDHSNAFPSETYNSIPKYFGLKDFFVANSKDVINCEEAKVILNSLVPLVAMCNNSGGCDIPLFVQYDLDFYQRFVGTLEYYDFKTSFETIEGPIGFPKDGVRGLKHCSEVFRENLGLDKDAPGVMVSARFIYVIWESIKKDKEEKHIGMWLPFDLVFSDTDVLKEFGKDWKIINQCANKFQLCVTWRNQLESDVIDFRNKNFNPLLAPDWSLRCRLFDAKRIALGYCLKWFMRLGSITKASKLISSPSLQIPSKPKSEINAELDLPESRVNRVTSKLTIDPDKSHIPLKSLDVILQYLFYEEKLDASQQSNGDNLGRRNNVEEVDDNFYDLYEEIRDFFKSTKRPNLITRLAICLCVVNRYHNNVEAVYQLWDEFVLELKYRWENSCEIAGLEPEESNFGFELLHQKLQMLNCCIKKKKDREASTSNRETITSRLSSHEKGIGRPETGLNASEADEISKSVQVILSALKYNTDICNTDTGCSLEGCNDWVEIMGMGESGVKTNKIYRGQLGLRVEILDGVSMVFGKRNFPDEEEAEKILHWLAVMKPSDLAFRFVPLLASLSVNTLLEQPIVQDSFLKRHLYKIKEMLGQIHLNSSDELEKYEEIICYLTLIEIRVLRIKCLLDRFKDVTDTKNLVSDFELQKFSSDLVEFGEASIPTTNNELPSDTGLGKLILKLFLKHYESTKDDDYNRPGSEAYPDFPEPLGKEYIITCSCQKAPDSKPIPQRVYFSCYISYLGNRKDSAITCEASL